MAVVISAAKFQVPHLKQTVSEAEWDARVNLAAAFRVAYHFNWNDKLTNHITCRVPDAPDQFLMNPHGLGWHEITASNLVKADFNGNVLSHKDKDVKLAPAGYNFHSGILKARPDLNFVMHVHTEDIVVISATEEGLMIVDQTACHLYDEVGYHAFEGYAQENEEVPRILRDLGDKHTLMMWNHGALAVGNGIPEAISYMRKLVDACALQVKLMGTGTKIRRIPEDVLKFTRVQIAEKLRNKPYADIEWAMYRRLIDEGGSNYAN